MEGSDNDTHDSDAAAQNINQLATNMPMPETVPSGTAVAETHVGEPLLGPSAGGGDSPPSENDDTHVSFFHR
jgi:hypothetical protein